MESLDTLAPGQLLRLTQIELRCVQERTTLFETTVPECVCEIVQQHATTAHRVSEILWTRYHVPVHGHRPSLRPSLPSSEVAP
jgi:hypothetical protein